MQVHRVDAHENEPEPIFAMCPTREIWETEETALDIMLVLCYRRRCNQLAHQSSRRSSIRLDKCRFFVRSVRIPKRTMHNIQRVTQLFLFCSTSLGVCDEELDDWRRVDNSAISLSKSACSSRDGLLSDSKLVVEIPEVN